MQRTFVWIVDINVYFRVNFHTRCWNYSFTSWVWQVSTAAEILELHNLLKSNLRISTRAYGMSFFIGLWVLFHVALSVLKLYQLFLPVGHYSRKTNLALDIGLEFPLFNLIGISETFWNVLILTFVNFPLAPILYSQKAFYL